MGLNSRPRESIRLVGVTHFEFASAVGAVYDRALFFSSIASSGCYEKSCVVIDRAYSRRIAQRTLKNPPFPNPQP